jgi:hypothetical protein
MTGFIGSMEKILILGLAAVIALSACMPQHSPSADITSSDAVCVESHFGKYCKDTQGNLISGPVLLAADY